MPGFIEGRSADPQCFGLGELLGGIGRDGAVVGQIDVDALSREGKRCGGTYAVVSSGNERNTTA